MLLMLISSGYERLGTYLAKKNIPFGLYEKEKKNKTNPSFSLKVKETNKNEKGKQYVAQKYLKSWSI